MSNMIVFEAVRPWLDAKGFTSDRIAALDAACAGLVASALGAPAPAEGELEPSAHCIELVKGFEQCRLQAFRPTPNDVPTIGWGATGPDVRMGMVWTQAQADARFVRDLAAFAAGVRHLLGGHATTQGQFDALVSFAYNVGLDDDADTLAEGLGDSTLLRKHLAGDYAGAAAEFAKWDKQKGVVLNGLVRRRAAEAALYLS